MSTASKVIAQTDTQTHTTKTLPLPHTLEVTNRKVINILFTNVWGMYFEHLSSKYGLWHHGRSKGIISLGTKWADPQNSVMIDHWAGTWKNNFMIVGQLDVAKELLQMLYPNIGWRKSSLIIRIKVSMRKLPTKA